MLKILMSTGHIAIEKNGHYQLVFSFMILIDRYSEKRYHHVDTIHIDQ